MAKSNELAVMVDLTKWVTAISKKHPELSREDCALAARLLHEEIGDDLVADRRIISVGVSTSGEITIDHIDIGALLKRHKGSR